MCMGSWGTVGLHLGLAKLLITIKTTHDTHRNGRGGGCASAPSPSRSLMPCICSAARKSLSRHRSSSLGKGALATVSCR